ncbi:MAG: hypothetical protein WCB00_11385 [Candidatus Acidiferrales bacterium]
MSKRQRKNLRTPEEKQGADNWFPGSGLSSEVPLGFNPKHGLRTDANFSAVPSDEIRAEIERQEKKLEDFGKAFPRVLTCTLGELSPVEEEVAKKMEAHQTALELLKSELASRFEVPSTPEVSPKSGAMPRDDEKFEHSGDYRSIWWNGKDHSLTYRQALVVQLLYEAYLAGTPGLSGAYILEKLEATTSRLRDSFRRSDLWGKGKLIIPGTKRGLYCLNLPDPAR